ncbi:NACHT domain-containing protein [Nannocystis punicea]|uniref:NACHT domain-containing protein n=1 Tax=Nannocystis punicea TaxID=2995304 RepID=A0ABY7GUL5_9BACT|nr:NACHT domain-containing protein [Nannocystis poenicansa]WAS90660.1 NACHT domain-containing protein [Nannocystis poenicansa]
MPRRIGRPYILLELTPRVRLARVDQTCYPQDVLGDGSEGLDLLRAHGVPPWLLVIIGVVVVGLALLNRVAELWNLLAARRLAGATGLSRRQVLLAQTFVNLANHSSETGWREQYYTELEAEVEVEVEAKRRWSSSTLPDRRLEKSLSAALLHCKHKLIHLEGDPGAGKSVSLRHLARRWLEKMSSGGATVVPLYLDLQRLRNPGGAIDRELIESFVHQELRRVRHPDIEAFIASDFHAWCREGRLLFLFDSFDELKDVLGSTEEDRIVDSYARAIQDFAFTMSACRVVVASRRFRGPNRPGWAHFLIRPLSDGKRVEFIRRHVEDPALARQIVGHLQISSREFQELCSNPLMLTLLCSHANETRAVPQGAHQLFAAFVERRLERDRYRIAQKFGRTVDELRAAAEFIALAMARDPELGLRPTRGALIDRVSNGKYTLEDSLLDALEMAHLLAIERCEDEPARSTVRFAHHRRLQEFFVSSHLVHNPGLVSPRLLLKDYRWREACVAMFQNLSGASVKPLVDTAAELVREYRCAASESPEEELGFVWPPKALHVLEVLQVGFAYGGKLPDALVDDIAWLVRRALERGNILDQKWALEVAGTAPEVELVEYIDFALLSGSRMLQDAAFLQVHRLRTATPKLRTSIRDMLEEMTENGKLREERFGIELKLGRLPDPDRWIGTARALRALPVTDAVLQVAFLTLLGGMSVLAGLEARTWLPHALFVFLTLSSLLGWALRSSLKCMAITSMRFAGLFSLAFAFDVSRIARGAIPHEIAVPVLVVTGYLALWPGFAMWGNLRGLFVKGWQRPFAPLAILLWWHWSKQAQWLGVVLLGEFILLAFILPALERSGFLNAGGLIALIGLVVVFGSWILWSAVNRSRDSSLFRSTIEDMRRSKDLREVLSWLGRFRTPQFRVEGLRTLRRHDVFRDGLSHLSLESARQILQCLEIDRWSERSTRREIRAEARSIEEQPADDAEWVLWWYYRHIGPDEVHGYTELADEFALALEPFVKRDRRSRA